MIEFSAVGAALSGYRLVFKKPLIVLAWAGLSLLVSLVVGGIMLAIMFPMMGNLGSLEAGDPAAVQGMVWRILPIYLIMLPAYLLVGAMIAAAVNRMILRPEDKGFVYFKLGGDEWRQILLMLVYFVLTIGAVGAWFLVSMVSGMVFNGGVGSMIGALVQFVLFGLFVFLSVRLSLASALTFTRKRVSIFDSWGVTKGRFWPMLGAYLLAGIIAFGALLAFYLLMIIVMMLGMGGALASMSQNSSTPDVAAFMTPAVIITYLLVLPVFQIFFIGINIAVQAPAPDILRQLTPETTVFD